MHDFSANIKCRGLKKLHEVRCLTFRRVEHGRLVRALTYALDAQGNVILGCLHCGERVLIERRWVARPDPLTLFGYHVCPCCATYLAVVNRVFK